MDPNAEFKETLQGQQYKLRNIVSGNGGALGLVVEKRLAEGVGIRPSGAVTNVVPVQAEFRYRSMFSAYW